MQHDFLEKTMKKRWICAKSEGVFAPQSIYTSPWLRKWLADFGAHVLKMMHSIVEITVSC